METKNRHASSKNSALRNEMHELSRERSEVASYIAMQLGDRLNAVELYVKELNNVLAAMEKVVQQHDQNALERITESIPVEFLKRDLVNLVVDAKADAAQLGEYADASVVSLLKPVEMH